MTVRARGRGGKSGVYFESILSHCSRTQCMSDGVLEDLQRGYLQASLKCLKKRIEQLSSSSTTFNMRFSWRLPRGIYPLEVSEERLSSSTEGVGREKVFFGPMKVLDDLSVCRQRVLLRLQPHLQTQPTLPQQMGKESWNRKKWHYVTFVRNVFNDDPFRVFGEPLIEPDIHPLTYLGSEAYIVLRGKVDMLMFVKVHDTFLHILFEFTLYENPSVIKDRLVAYASAVYNMFGYYVVPVIVIMKDYERDIVRNVLICRNLSKYGISRDLLRAFRQLEKLVTGDLRVRKPGDDVCYQCDVDIGRICPIRR